MAKTTYMSGFMRSDDAEMEELAGEVARMGGLVEEMLEKSVRSVVEMDKDMARSVIRRDIEVDEMEALIEARTLAFLEARSPTSRTLRQAIVSMRVAYDLERVGDLSKNIAKRTLSPDFAVNIEQARDLSRMGRLVFAQLRRVLDALSAQDDQAAQLVWNRDDEVDDLNSSFFRVLVSYMIEDPGTITGCAHLLFMAKNLERIGDHCINIAETIRFLVTGERVTNERPKGDELPE